MNFSLTEKERLKILTFIEHHLLFVENNFMLNKFRDIIKNNDIPDLAISTVELREFLDRKQGPYVYMVEWTPVGFRYMLIDQTDKCQSFTDQEELKNNFNTQRATFYDKDRDKLYTYEELLQIRPFTLLFMNTGIGKAIRIVCEATNESVNVTDYENW